MKFVIPKARFNHEDANRARDTWGANCGPGAIAGILGKTPEEVRPFMGDFESKGYTNPTLMWEVLKGLKVKFSVARARRWPNFGLARVQWHGPWTKPGVPERVAYRHSHWVASIISHERGHVIFDVNMIWAGGWCPFWQWRDGMVPSLLRECEPQADGEFHVTHCVEIHK